MNLITNRDIQSYKSGNVIKSLNDKWLKTNPIPLTDAAEIEKILLQAW